MTNKEKFLQKLKNENLELGIYNEEIDKLSTEELNRVIEQVVYEHTDVSITLDGIKRVIEFAQVDDEVDLTFMTEKAYVAQYG